MSLLRRVCSKSCPSSIRAWSSFYKRSLYSYSKLYASSDTFMQGNSSLYMDQMYEEYKKNPENVHSSWRSYFGNLEKNVPPAQAYQSPPTMVPVDSATVTSAHSPFPTGPAAQSFQSPEVLDHLKVQLLVRAYQVRGHVLANIDPLGLHTSKLDPQSLPELDYKYYGFTEADLNKKFSLGVGILSQFSKTTPSLTLGEIIQNLKSVYCGSIGIEYSHIPSRSQCNWLRERVEIPNRCTFTTDQRRRILDRLIWSDSFERFIAAKWPSEKRFGLEGCEALVPGMKALVDRAVENGVDSVVIGMPHRGRLNVLSNVVRKNNASIFNEFSGSFGEIEGTGDVKYHLGAHYDRPTPCGKHVHLSLMANPSHLEAVDPVVEGKTRSIQFYKGDSARLTAMSVLLHGDAAFSAQGVVYETLGFSDLPAYTTGGTIHIICNNQIGFTTDPRFARSSPYCSDLAKAFNAPIIHVNGDDVEAVVFACRLASDWRQTFGKSVVVDIMCYRRYGHNEIDQPSFTQPLMYQIISKKVTALEQYKKKLVNEFNFSQEEIDENVEKVWNTLEAAYANSKNYIKNEKEWLSSPWDEKWMKEALPIQDTGVSADTLQSLGIQLATYPVGFTVHRNLVKILQARRSSVESGEGIDWATAESLAFGSLMLEGKHVRLSGQDVERGTFSQRHAVLHDQKTEEYYIPLAKVSPNQAPFTVSNSSLSEFGTLGFEYGYSLNNPNALILWEAQFGDFANNAQCIFDQFIASGEGKWAERTGLVVLLPHGYDGQGPEHSSARIERYLQLCAEDPYTFPNEAKMAVQHQNCNMQVVYCSTPAQYFHVLRRQIHRDFRKPLVIFTSKSLLRHPMCRSSLKDMAEGTRFVRYIPESHQNADIELNEPEKIKKHILCTGQVYYALHRTRSLNGIKNVAISRVEQLSPFPFDMVAKHLPTYPNAEVIWCQEEPLNMGAWSYVQPRLDTCLQHLAKEKKLEAKRIRFVGRAPSATVATGVKHSHIKEEVALLSHALNGDVRKPKDFVNGIPKW